MKFSRLFLNRLHNLPVVHDTVVVIDTLRSFTTAAVALDRGAAAIYPVEGISAAQALAQGLGARAPQVQSPVAIRSRDSTSATRRLNS